MSEPTPLSAEELAGYRACHRKTTGTTADAEGNLHPECICGDYWPCWPSQLFATIDAQATEIAALKGALAAVIPWIDGEPRDRAYRMALLRYNDSAGGGTETDVLNELERQRQVVFRAARVLAGKEAQGG